MRALSDETELPRVVNVDSNLVTGLEFSRQDRHRNRILDRLLNFSFQWPSAVNRVKTKLTEAVHCRIAE